MAQIILEGTLSDFFAIEDQLTETKPPQKVYVSYSPISDLDLTANLPRNTKYLLPQWRTFNGNGSSPLTNLILTPQKMSWITGKMPVIFLKDEKQESGIYSNLEVDLAETMSVIDPQCRLQPIFCTSLEEIRLRVNGSLVIPYLPSDGLAQIVPHHTKPDVHYELLTKRALALSGLPTPRAQIIDFNDSDMCCLGGSLDNAVNRTISIIQNRVLPFVLKTNYCAGGRGTYVVRSPADQAAVVESVRNILRLDLQKLHPDNVHLYPCSLILTDLLPGKAVAINFYVKCSGQTQFSSCCEQLLSKTDHWQGAAITYSMQSQLAARYAEVVQETGAFLHSRGYHGPVGIDIMTNELGQQNVIDLNPRPTGSFILGCLRPHFAGELAMNEACVLPTMELSTSRASFKTAFEKELQVGEIVILAWCSDLDNSRSFACLALGGKDKASLQGMCGRIEKWVLCL